MSIWDTIGSFLGPVGGIASTVIDAISQSHTNKANAQMAQNQMDFQDKESSTAYQRGVQDLQKAGLNPGLAYQGAQASSPQGATAQMQPTFSNTASKFATALDTYNTLATGAAQRDLIAQQASAAQADARLKTIQGTVAAPDEALAKDPAYLQNFVASKKAGLTAAQLQSEFTPTQLDLNKRTAEATIANTKQNTATAEGLAQLYRSQNILNDQQMQNEWYRKNISPYINSTAQAIKTFTPLFKLQ